MRRSDVKQRGDSSKGMKGADRKIPAPLPAEMTDRIRQHSPLPIAVGFGISNPAQAREVATHAEGTGTDGQVRFAAPNAGLFSYLWKNTGSMPVRLTARLSSQGAVRVHSIHPAP